MNKQGCLVVEQLENRGLGGRIFGSLICSRRTPPPVNHFHNHAANDDMKQNLTQYKNLYKRAESE